MQMDGMHGCQEGRPALQPFVQPLGYENDPSPSPHFAGFPPNSRIVFTPNLPRQPHFGQYSDIRVAWANFRGVLYTALPRAANRYG